MNYAKIKALADFINESKRSILEANKEEGIYSFFDEEFLVLTEDEANKRIKVVLYEQLGDGLSDKITDWNKLAEEMISKHGRETYLAADSEENNEGGYLIYRIS